MATLATAGIYLSLAWSGLGVGYPLDDAWIHQTYARNLAELGEWAYTPGVRSAGSTAPLWSAWLSISYFIRIEPKLWTYSSGLTLLAISGWLAARWYADRYPEKQQFAWVLAALIPIEWHLAWAGLSGMETLAVGALALLCFYLVEGRRTGPLLIGLLVGSGIWIRPDVLSLVVVPVGYYTIRDRERKLKQWLLLAIGFILPVATYLLFQRWLSGEFWPNTLYAKQAEYAILRELPLPTRLLMQFGIPGRWVGLNEIQEGGIIVGVFVVLLPGLIVTTSYYVRSKRWERLIPLVWVGIYLSAYAILLPVTYQHGRYAIPVLPVLLAISFEGLARWVQPSSDHPLRRVISRAWVIVAGITGLAFWIIGAGAYQRDVAIIESEMVATAHWISEKTPPTAIFAVHDIGAIGYYGDRELVDLAGLISPDVIPIIRDEAELASYLDRAGADYLVTFPGWYPLLTEGKSLIFTTEAPFSPALGGENMAIFEWN